MDREADELTTELQQARQRITELESELKEVRHRLAEPRRNVASSNEPDTARTDGRLVRETRLSTLAQIAGSLAHDLRNPIGLIRNALYMLRRQYPDETERCARLLGIIDEAIRDADRTVSDLTALSQSVPPAKQVVDLRRVVEDAQAHTRRTDRLVWQCLADPEPFFVEADPAQLEQVLRNLASNSVEAGATSFQVQASRTTRGDEIVVSDDGSGVPAERRAEVFEPLFTTKRLGAGLGLAICHQIIRSHGGTIEPLAVPQGATFLIRLPSADGINRSP